VFDALSRTMPCRWDAERIVVLDAVVIFPPYGTADCKAVKGVASGSLGRVKKVLEMERKKLAANPTWKTTDGEQKKGG